VTEGVNVALNVEPNGQRLLWRSGIEEEKNIASQVQRIETKTFFIFVLAIQLGFLGFSFSSFFIPELSWLAVPVSVIYLSFVPGILMLRIIRNRSLNFVVVLPYSVGRIAIRIMPKYMQMNMVGCCCMNLSYPE
jgi:hypothetical protein